MWTYNKLFKEIDGAMNATRNRTQKKEAIGRQLLEDSGLLNKWFKDNKGYKWVEEKYEQLEGTDYLLWTKRDNEVSIDIKSCIGPDYQRIPVEYEQYTEEYGDWQRTFTNDKKTDFLLFINISTNDEKIDFVLVNYRWLVKEIDKVIAGEKTIFDQTIPKESFNHTGTYFTIDLEKCLASRQMFVEEYSFKDLTKPGRKSKCPLEKILEQL